MAQEEEHPECPAIIITALLGYNTEQNLYIVNMLRFLSMGLARNKTSDSNLIQSDKVCWSGSNRIYKLRDSNQDLGAYVSPVGSQMSHHQELQAVIHYVMSKLPSSQG